MVDCRKKIYRDRDECVEKRKARKSRSRSRPSPFYLPPEFQHGFIPPFMQIHGLQGVPPGLPCYGSNEPTCAGDGRCAWTAHGCLPKTSQIPGTHCQNHLNATGCGGDGNCTWTSFGCLPKGNVNTTVNAIPTGIPGYPAPIPTAVPGYSIPMPAPTNLLTW